MKQTSGVLAAVIALTAIPAVAEAQDQPWLRDRKYTEGIGYRVGDFELHPGIAGEFGYDSNYLRRAPDANPVGSLRLRITPSLSLSTLGKERMEQGGGGSPPNVEFRAGISATYNEFFPVSGPEADQVNMHYLRNVSGNIDLSLNILPSRPWSGQLYASVARVLTASEQGITGSSFNRIMPRAGAELIWTPGGGLLDWRLGYQFSGTIFESGRYTDLTNVQNRIETRGRWRFLPRTALMYDAKFDFINYTNPADPATGGKTASHPMRALIGVNGLITSSFSLLAQVGWGASFYTPKSPPLPAMGKTEDFDSVIGQLELKWYITPNPSNDPSGAGLALSTLSVGFVRDFYDSFIGTYFERDRGYANFAYFFGGRFLIVVEGGAGPIIYPTIPHLGPGNSDLAPFTDVRLDASLFGEYRFKSPFGINATIRYGQNISGTSIQDPMTLANDSLKWQEFEAYLGARWLM